MSHDPNFGWLLPLIIAVAIYASYRHVKNAKAVLQDWAQANHFRILRARLCLLMPWRIYFTTSEYRVVYQVSVYDESTHRVRAAWVRLGTRVWGVMQRGAVDVEWANPDEAGPQ